MRICLLNIGHICSQQLLFRQCIDGDLTMDPSNLYDFIPKEYLPDRRTYDNFDKLKINLPFRMLAVGTSSSGKTTSVLDMLTKINAFSQWVLLVKRPDEPLYRWLIVNLQQLADETGNSEIRCGRAQHPLHRDHRIHPNRRPKQPAALPPRETL